MINILTTVISYLFGYHHASKRRDVCVLTQQTQTPPCLPLEDLKNALLAYALMNVGKEDDNFYKDYDRYDGTTLPPLSGWCMTHACFSYIHGAHPPLNNTPLAMAKQDAIKRYLDKNLSTTDQVMTFFERFHAHIIRKNDTNNLVTHVD